MKFSNAAALAALGFALSGCASIVTGTTQMIAVSSPPVEGASCSLTSSEGTVNVVTPGSVKVHKTKSDLHVVCNKDGYKEGSAVLVSHFNGATVGNVILGGGIGLIVDASTGANFTFPDKVEVPMESLAGPATPPTPADAPAAKPGS
jgi:hypothetical protein